MSNPSARALAAPPLPPRIDGLLRACVHCGFCNATCPTYQLSGDEREGPRGRLYLIKEVLVDGQDAPLDPLEHCLTCRSCETTCPAGIQYAEILDHAREHTNHRRPWTARLADRLLAHALGSRTIVRSIFGVLRATRPLTPHWSGAIEKSRHLTWPAARHTRKVAILQGCLQPHMMPDLDHKAAIILDHCGVSAIPLGPACCGALPHHLHEASRGRQLARERLAQWQPDWAGVTSTASGCTSFMAEYPRLLGLEAAHARAFAEKVADIAAFIDPGTLPQLPPEQRMRIAFHAPCTLQHGLRGHERVEAILRAIGHTLVPTDEPALCCGSAGPYSLRHPGWGRALGRRKWHALTGGKPQQIVTANIGCLRQLATQADRPVRHWVDVVYDAITTSQTTAHD
ncbi:MAG: glycolate oxidase subunit GlcF [Gammaproteobacteria bacterium]|nr:glycolate oxidase subunit GlcF [Gammaproteobacteria bacterium]